MNTESIEKDLADLRCDLLRVQRQTFPLEAREQEIRDEIAKLESILNNQQSSESGPISRLDRTSEDNKH